MALKILHVTNFCMEYTDGHHSDNLSGISFYNLLEDPSKLDLRFNIINMPYAKLFKTLAQANDKLSMSILFAYDYLKPQVLLYD